jgi:MFS family permease
MLLVVVVAWSAPELPTTRVPGAASRRTEVWEAMRSRPFVLGIALTAPWVFGAASTSFATLPSFVEIDVAPIAVTGALAGLALWSGVAIQPLGRRLGDPRLIITTGLGATAAGLLTGVLLARSDLPWLLLPATILLGIGYGLILVGGLTTVEQLAHPDDLGTLNAIFYSLTYLGFAAPLLNTLALKALSPTELMLVGVGVIAVTVLGVRTSAGSPRPAPGDGSVRPDVP